MDFRDPAAQRSRVFHLGNVVQQKQHLTVTGAREHLVLGIARKLRHEAGVLNAAFAAHLVEIDLPRLAVRRIGQHEVELPRRKTIGGKRGAEADVFCLLAFARKQHIRLGDGIGLRVDLLSEQVDGYLPVALCRVLIQAVLGDRQHAARTASPVVAGISAVLDLVRDRQKDQIRHQFYDVARREVFARFFVILFVEAPDQLFEDHAHGVVVQSGQSHRAVVKKYRIRRQIDRRRDELFDDRAQNIRVHHRRYLIAEFEFVQDFLNVRRKAVEISLEIRFELLRFGARPQVFQAELRTVAECFARDLAQRRRLIGDPCRIELFLHLKDRGLGLLQHRVEAAYDRHRQNHVTIFAAHIDIPQAVVGDVPDEIGDGAELQMIHYSAAFPDFTQASSSALSKSQRLPTRWAGMSVRLIQPYSDSLVIFRYRQTSLTVIYGSMSGLRLSFIMLLVVAEFKNEKIYCRGE